MQRQFALPRRLRSVSAMAHERPAPDARVIDVVHLNGTAGADATDLTFSTMQYASRLCARDREYSQLVADLEQSPFVFVGTTLDEVILWQHLELHRQRTGDTQKQAPSFLVSASLTRARQYLLESMGIRWIRSTVAEIAEHLL